MNNRQNRRVAVVTGVAAVATSVGSTMLGFSGPALAAGTAPACDATQSDTAFAATLAASNSATVKAYTKGKAFTSLHANSTKAKAAYGKAKGKAKAAAKKKWQAAVAKENAALAAFKKANAYTSFSGSITPPRIAANQRQGLWDWGTYTTRIIIKGSKLSDVCTFVDQTNDGNDLGTAATAEDKQTSLDLYQGSTKPITLDIPGQLPVMWYAAVAAPAKTVAGIEANVQQCVTQNYTVTTAPCIKGGLTDPVTHATGASYTVGGFTGSLHAALTAAQTAGKLG